MGHEQRRTAIDATIEAAQIERLMGPTKPFQARDELGCEKCSAPVQAFLKRWCHGPNRLAPVADPKACRTDGEHLHVFCQACGYGWIEHCRDYVVVTLVP